MSDSEACDVDDLHYSQWFNDELLWTGIQEIGLELGSVEFCPFDIEHQSRSNEPESKLQQEVREIKNTANEKWLSAQRNHFKCALYFQRNLMTIIEKNKDDPIFREVYEKKAYVSNHERMNGLSSFSELPEFLSLAYMTKVKANNIFLLVLKSGLVNPENPGTKKNQSLRTYARNAFQCIIDVREWAMYDENAKKQLDDLTQWSAGDREFKEVRYCMILIVMNASHGLIFM